MAGTGQYGFGTGTRASRVMSTTQSECSGTSYPFALRSSAGSALSPGLCLARAHMLTTRIFDVTYTPTADFVLSASDDGNVRIWKSRASQKLGPVSVKERNAIEYRQKLVDKWGSAGDVRSVKDRRHVPQSVHNAVKLNREMRDSIRNKDDRRRKHSRASREKPKAERKSEYLLRRCCLWANW